jgi:hypothetical protein
MSVTDASTVGRVLTRQKLIAQLKPTFCAAVRTCVYAKKKAMVTRAPMIMVPRLPQNHGEAHIAPARTGPQIDEKFAKA